MFYLSLFSICSNFFAFSRQTPPRAPFFFAPSVSSVVSRRPSRNSNLVPRLAVVGVVLPLSSRTAAAGKQKILRL